jgi:hypothetical protein
MPNGRALLKSARLGGEFQEMHLLAEFVAEKRVASEIGRAASSEPVSSTIMNPPRHLLHP